MTPSGVPFPNPLPDFLVAANISWQIDIWRRLRNAPGCGRRCVTWARLTVETRHNPPGRRDCQEYYRLMGLDKQLETWMAPSPDGAKPRIRQGPKARGPRHRVGRPAFLAKVRKNPSQKLIVRQEIIQTQNRINFLCARYPQPVERISAQFLELQLQALRFGVPSQLLLDRPDIRQAERS